jgi:hypothetical protein
MATAVPARLGLNRFSGYEAANGLLMNSSLGFMHVLLIPLQHKAYTHSYLPVRTQ